MTKKGLFVTFEGGEGCGKSTVSRMVAKMLEERQIDYIWTREPGGTPISEKIREILLDPENKEMNDATEALLYAASRAQHTLEKILPAINAGKVVLCDRYIDSSIAYQGTARGRKVQDIEAINDFGIWGLRPDVCFFIDTPVDVALARIQERNLDRLEQEDKSFHEKVYKGFVDRSNKCHYYVRLDGTLTPEEIAANAFSILLSKMK